MSVQDQIHMVAVMEISISEKKKLENNTEYHRPGGGGYNCKTFI